MKVTINLKKETPFKKLFVKTDDVTMFEKIKASLKSKGADDEKINSFIKENDYKGKISYPFDLMCSRQTWAAVERFAELDCKIDFGVNEKGYCFAKINVIEGVEQVLSYTKPTESEEVVTAWACGAIPAAVVIVEQPEQPTTISAPSEDLPF